MYPISLRQFQNNAALRRHLFAYAREDRRRMLRAGVAWLRRRLPGFGPSIVGRRLARLG